MKQKRIHPLNSRKAWDKAGISVEKIVPSVDCPVSVITGCELL